MKTTTVAKRFLTLFVLLNATTVGLGDVVGTGNSSLTFGDSDAFTIFNDTDLSLNQVRLEFSVAGQGAWDDNVPGQEDSAFIEDGSSDFTGVTHSFADPSPAAADFNAWRTLVLDFSDFDPGETLVFGADPDGSINAPLGEFGDQNTGAFADILSLTVEFSNGFVNTATYSLVEGELITASVAIPEPASTVVIFGLGAMMSGRRKRRS